MANSFWPSIKAPSANSAAKSTALVEKYKQPEISPHLEKYRNMATTPAQTECVQEYEEKRKTQSTTGQDKINVLAEIRTVQRAKGPVMRRIDALNKRKQTYEDKITACNQRNAKYPNVVKKLAVREKELCEQEETVKTEIGYDKLRKEETSLEERKGELQDDKDVQKKRRSAAQRSIGEFDKKIDRVTKEKAELGEEESELKTDTESLAKQIETLSPTIKTLEDKLEGLEEDRTKQVGRENYLLDKIDGYKTSRRSAAARSERTADREGELKEVGSKIDALDEEIKACRDELRPQQLTLTDLRKEAADKNRKLVECRRDIRGCETDIATAKRNREKERDILEDVDTQLAPIDKELKEVEDQLKDFDARFKKFDDEQLKDINSGLADIQKQYAEFGISSKEQLAMRKTLETIERHQVEVENLESAIAAQEKKLDALQDDEDTKLLKVDMLQGKMSDIKTRLTEISRNMKSELDERDQANAARLRIEAAPSVKGKQKKIAAPPKTAATGFASSSRTAPPRTPLVNIQNIAPPIQNIVPPIVQEAWAPVQDDAAVRNYRWADWMRNGWEMFVSGIDATPTHIVEAVNQYPTRRCYFTTTEQNTRRTFSVYGPRQQESASLTLPDGTAWQVPTNSPYYYIYECARTEVLPATPQNALPRHATTGAARTNLRYPAAANVANAAGYMASMGAGVQYNPQYDPNNVRYDFTDNFTGAANTNFGYGGNYAQGYAQTQTQTPGTAMPNAYNRSGGQAYATQTTGATGATYPSNSTTTPGVSQRRGPAPQETPRPSTNPLPTRRAEAGRTTGDRTGGERSTRTKRPKVNYWEQGMRSHTSLRNKLEWISDLSSNYIPPEVQKYFADHPSENFYYMKAYSGFCSVPHEEGQLKKLYVVVRPNLQRAVRLERHPGQLRIPEGAPYYVVSELPRHNVFGSRHADHSDDGSSSELDAESDYEESRPRRPQARRTPRSGGIPRSRTDIPRASARAPSPLRRSTTDDSWNRRRERTARAPWDEFMGGMPGYTPPYERGATGGGGNTRDSGTYDRYQRPREEFRDDTGYGHTRERTRGTQGDRERTNSSEQSNQQSQAKAPPAREFRTPVTPEEIFIAKKVTALKCKGSAIDMTKFKERRLDADEMQTTIITPLKNNGLTDQQRTTLMESLGLLLNYSRSDVEKIPALSKLFADYVAEKKKEHKDLRGERDLSSDQRHAVDDACKVEHREKIKALLRQDEEADLGRKHPGMDNDAVKRRADMLELFALDLSTYFDIKDNGRPDPNRPTRDATGRIVQKRTISMERENELKRLVDRAQRNPSTRLTDEERRTIMNNKISGWNAEAKDGVESKDLAFAKAYLDRLYHNVFNADLSDIASNPAVRVNILKMRAALR